MGGDTKSEACWWSVYSGGDWMAFNNDNFRDVHQFLHLIRNFASVGDDVQLKLGDGTYSVNENRSFRI